MKTVKLKSDIDTGLKNILKNLLENKKVDAVFGLGQLGDALNYLLIADPDKIEDLRPGLPFMPENAANYLSELTSGGAFPNKVAVVVKPCELRAFGELVKRESGNRENLVFISPVCGGVLDFDTYNNGEIENALPDYWKAFYNNENPPKIRPTCEVCKYLVPFNTDITVLPTKAGCELYLNTDVAEDLLAGSGEISEGGLDESRIEPLKKLREAKRASVFAELELEKMEIKGLVEAFGKCLGCHGCSSVCPICYCALCAFDAKENEYKPDVFEKELVRRGGLRVPPNTVFFHLGRIAHMSISCVGCGMCADICPVDIPVASIFTRVGDAVQEVFDYVPGADLEEPVPLSTFIEDELTEVED